MTKLAELTGCPVVTTIMGKGAVPTSHPLYIGNIGIHGSFAANSAISHCDLLFSIGTRFNDRITGKIEEFAKVPPSSTSTSIQLRSPEILPSMYLSWRMRNRRFWR